MISTDGFVTLAGQLLELFPCTNYFMDRLVNLLALGLLGNRGSWGMINRALHTTQETDMTRDKCQVDSSSAILVTT